MKKFFFLFTALIFCSVILYAEDTNTTKKELLEEKDNSKIIIPDVKLSIEDESEVPLKNDNGSILTNRASDYGRIDIEELSKTKASDKFKSEMLKERKKEDFSMSTFKMFYGLYDNIIAEMNTGKRSGNFNYLVTYLRNTRGNVGYQGQSYFNTEMNIDDLNGDLIYSVSSNLDLTGSFGYYVRDIGLFTNETNITETKKNVPLRLGTLYNFNINTTLKGSAYYNYLDLTHKMISGYDTKNLWEAGCDIDFESNWSRDNFLKLSGKYSYSSFSNDILHFGRFSVLNKFPVFSNISFQAGLEFDVYNYKGFFWYPNIMLFYKYSGILSMKAGLYGEQNNLSLEKLVNENQIDYRFTYPEEKWVYLYSIQYSPVQFINLRGNASYQQYYSYMNYAYMPESGLYSFSSISNVNVLEIEGILELIAFDSLILNASYIFRLPSETNLLFFSQNQVSINVEYNYADWGFTAGTRLTYKDSQKYQTDAYFDPRLIWDISLSQAVSKDISIELLFKNILNQNNFERPDIPAGGFSVNAGVRIIL